MNNYFISNQRNIFGRVQRNIFVIPQQINSSYVNRENLSLIDTIMGLWQATKDLDEDFQERQQLRSLIIADYKHYLSIQGQMDQQSIDEIKQFSDEFHPCAIGDLYSTVEKKVRKTHKAQLRKKNVIIMVHCGFTQCHDLVIFYKNGRPVIMDCGDNNEVTMNRVIDQITTQGDTIDLYMTTSDVESYRYNNFEAHHMTSFLPLTIARQTRMKEFNHLNQRTSRYFWIHNCLNFIFIGLMVMLIMVGNSLLQDIDYKNHLQREMISLTDDYNHKIKSTPVQWLQQYKLQKQGIVNIKSTIGRLINCGIILYTHNIVITADSISVLFLSNKKMGMIRKKLLEQKFKSIVIKESNEYKNLLLSHCNMDLDIKYKYLRVYRVEMKL